MKLTVFGAAVKTGLEIVSQALAKQHEKTAFGFDPSRLTLENATESVYDRLRLVSGDVFDFSAGKKATMGQEAMICSLGSNSLGKSTVRGEGTANIAKATEEEHVERLIIVSAMGTEESWSSLSFANKLICATLLRSSRQDHEAQEAVAKEISLDWTILRPSGLPDGALTETYAIGENIVGESSRIARFDVAHAIIKELDDSALVHMAVTITN